MDERKRLVEEIASTVAHSFGGKSEVKHTQQYINSLKLLLKIAGDIGENEETSPLREWIKKKNEEMDA